MVGPSNTTTLLVAEHDNKTLKDATHKALTAAKALGQPVHVLVAGKGCRPVAEAAAKLDGVTKVLLADGAAYEHMLAEPLAALIVALAPLTRRSSRRRPPPARTSCRASLRLLDVMQISDIVKVIAPDTFERLIYAGNAVQTVRSKDKIKVITVRTSTFQATGAGGSRRSRRRLPPPIRAFPASSARNCRNPSARSSPRPRSSFPADAAMQSRENFTKYIEPVADKLGAAVGASRAAVDAGYAPNDWQVGQTGKVVAPELYIAVGHFRRDPASRRHRRIPR